MWQPPTRGLLTGSKRSGDERLIRTHIVLIWLVALGLSWMMGLGAIKLCLVLNQMLGLVA